MRSLLSIQPKYKVALTLLVMVSLILTGTLLERQFFSDINSCSSSIYKDRLIPATAIFHIGDHFSQRRFLIDEHDATPKNTLPQLRETLVEHTAAIDSIIAAFEKTYLVKPEGKSLASLKEHARSYTLAEAGLLDGMAAGRGPAGFEDLREEYEKIRLELMELSTIQTTVGKKLMSDTEDTVAQAHVVSDFQVSILLITCIIAQMFIVASRAISPPIRQKHHLN